MVLWNECMKRGWEGADKEGGQRENFMSCRETQFWETEYMRKRMKWNLK